VDDLRHALRALRREPGFAAVAILTLAFGIGVNVSLFGMLSAFFLRPLAVAESDRLVFVLQRSDIIAVPFGHSYPDYRDYRSGARTLTDLAAFTPQPAHISPRGGTPDRTWIEVVSPNYFALARVSPAAGTFPSGDSFDRGGPPVIVLAHQYWQRRFGADPGIVGQTISINGRPFTVAAIAPPGFTGLSWAMAVSGFVPAGAMEGLSAEGSALRELRGAPAWRLMGRLTPGRTLADARAEIAVIARRLASDFPAEHRNSQPLVIPENRARPDPSLSEALPIAAVVFAIMVGLVLLIACANVSNLLLSRALTRQRDLVVRAALGAGRLRLMRLQILETLVLAGIAGVAGLLLAQWSGGAIAGLIPAGDIPVNEHREWDWRIYAFTAAVSLATGVVAGLVPARRATRFDLVASLKEGGAAVARSRHVMRSALVIGQIAMSFVVLVAAGLFLRSLVQMRDISPGFQPRGLVAMSLDLGLQGYGESRGRQFIDELLRRAGELPAVTSATVTVHVPFDYGMAFANVAIDGTIPGSKDDTLSVPYTVAGPHYFDTLGTSVTRGRAFDSRDTARSRLVAVVNETMASRLWPGVDPIGRRFSIDGRKAWIEVAGVAADGKYVMLSEQTRPYFYLPLDQHYRSPVTLVVRAAGDAGALAPQMRQLLRTMDPDLPVFNLRTMESHVAGSVFGLLPLRVGAWLGAVQGAIALLLAVMGLYAVVSHGAIRRTREIGVRMALGAQRLDVVRLVAREVMWLWIAGIAVGLAAALVLGRVVSMLLYGLKPVEPTVLAGVGTLRLAVSALACYVPVRRATRLPPLAALRHE
jgi:predicted permease